MKKCKRCNKKKGLNEFYKLKSNADGLAGKCMECTKLSNREYYRKNSIDKALTPCAVCYDPVGESNNRIKRRPICTKCHNLGYVLSGEVADSVGVSRAAICKYVNDRKVYAVPEGDAMLGDKFTLWKRTTVDEFVKNMPDFDYDEINVYLNLGYSRAKIAKALNVHPYHIFRYLRVNNLRTSTKGVYCMEKGSRHYSRVEHAYNAANRIMNERISL